tara:strand:+ start:320 stop:661 length:342 start_codon:yes stop_codon:yes gene_type:complete
MNNIINHKEGYILSLKLLWTANTWSKKDKCNELLRFFSQEFTEDQKQKYSFIAIDESNYEGLVESLKQFQLLAKKQTKTPDSMRKAFDLIETNSEHLSNKEIARAKREVEWEE